MGQNTLASGRVVESRATNFGVDDGIWPRPLMRFASDAESARLVRLAENVGHMGHWHTDLLTDLITWSPEVYRIFGVDPETFTPDLLSVLALWHPEDRAVLESKLQEVISAGKSAFEFDFRITRPDGARRNLISNGQTEVDNSGRVVALFGVVADVTEAFETIRSIRDQNEMLDLAARLAQLGHWVWSEDEGRVRFCSDEMARLHESDPDTFLSTFTHPKLLATAVIEEQREHYCSTIINALRDARSYEIGYRLQTPSGTIKDIHEIGQPILDRDGRLVRFIATVQDVSISKRRENDLRQTQEELRVADEALKKKTRELEHLNLQKDKLFSIIAHDLRNPFNSIIGFADLLVTSARNLSHGQTVSYAQIVRDSATGVQNLLDKLLEWASFQIRDSSLNVSDLDLAAVTAAGLEPLAYMAENKGVTIANSISSIGVAGDEALVRIVIRNLVSNGIKFSRNGGVVQLTAVKLPKGQGCAPDAPPGTPMVRVTVRDDGVGMTAAAIENLFALDRTVSAAGTRGEKGTGLGLFLCRDIVMRHGGVISVESAPGVGTAFHFTLPAAS